MPFQNGSYQPQIKPTREVKIYDAWGFTFDSDLTPGRCSAVCLCSGEPVVAHLARGVLESKTSAFSPRPSAVDFQFMYFPS